jgi:hypothetical protein
MRAAVMPTLSHLRRQLQSDNNVQHLVCLCWLKSVYKFRTTENNSPRDSMPPKATSAGRQLWLKLRPLWPALASNDLLRDATYRRLWTSILISSFGGQITMLALPLTAAILLHATPSQMGILTAMELAPFVLLSLPSGVWLDRVRKLPVYVIGEGIIALVLSSVPLSW